jgi:hypothetical protein
MIPQSQPLPDLPTPGFTGHAEPRLTACERARTCYLPREVPTVDPREVAACMAAWDALGDDALAMGEAMSADPVAYRKRVRK